MLSGEWNILRNLVPTSYQPLRALIIAGTLQAILPYGGIRVSDSYSEYLYLTWYPPHVSYRQCKMYKRRVDLLEPLLTELNPTYYLMVIRQLQYELAEIYSDIAQCKVEVGYTATSHSARSRWVIQCPKIC